MVSFFAARARDCTLLTVSVPFRTKAALMGPVNLSAHSPCFLEPHHIDGLCKTI